MTVLLTRTYCCVNLYSKWQHRVRKSQRQLDFPFYSKHSFKTSHWSQTRWPGKRLIKNSEDQPINIPLSSLTKPFLFTLAVSGCSLAGAALWQYESWRYRNSKTSNWFGLQSPKYGWFRQRMHDWWQSISTADKVFTPICFINVMVFLAWQIPTWHSVMARYFLSGVTPKVLCWPMLLSVFSHYNILHLGANMFVLHSFSERAVSVLGKEQFVAVYLSAGVISSFTSHFYKALIGSSTMSLGASGAVMCVLGFVCSKFPDSKLAIIFLPQYSFDAATGLKSIICLDFLGCILRFSFLDHAAHLGGSLFGIMWHHFGQDHIWKKREPFVNAWHKLRGPL